MKWLNIIFIGIILTMISACSTGLSPIKTETTLESGTPSFIEIPTVAFTPQIKIAYLSTLNPSFSYYVYATREIGAIGGVPLVAHGQNYIHGIVAHAPSAQVYELKGEYDRFISEIVFSDDPSLNSQCGDGAYFAVILDGEVKYLSPILNYDSEPIHIDIDITGGNILRLDTYGSPDITANNECDWTFWGDPYLVTNSETQMNSLLTSATPTVDFSVDSTMTEFYVSPEGDDNNPGTFDQPFATLQHARDAVRKNNQKMKSDITVYLREGIYALSNTIDFSTEDSGSNGFNIFYKAYQKEKPVLSGGVEISGFESVPDKPYWKVELPENINPFRNLYVNGIRATRAQTEKPIAGIGWIKGDYTDNDGILLSTEGPGWWVSQWGNTETIMNPENLPVFSKPSELELHWFLDWVDIRARVANIEQLENNQIAIMMQQPFFAWARGINEGAGTKWYPRWDAPFYIENAIELLDQPGEWYFDKLSYDLFYYPKPGEELRDTFATIPQLEKLMSIHGSGIGDEVHNIIFSGLSFSYNSWMRASDYGTAGIQAQVLQDGIGGYTDDTFMTFTPSAVQLEHVKNIHFTQNSFEHIGSVGLGLDNNVKDVQIIGNLFQDISDSALTLSQGYRHAYMRKPDEDTVSNILINNNLIHRTSLEYWGAPGIAAYFVNHITISHNLIKEINYSGICIGWGHSGYPASNTSHDNLIVNNRIEMVALGEVNANPEFQGDAGGIYTLGQQPGTLIEGNYVKDVMHNKPCYYLDEGSAFISLNNNICENAGEWTNFWNPNIHDNKIRNTYTNVWNHTNNGINNIIEKTVYITGQDWSNEAKIIMENAGIESQYEELLNQISQ